MTRETTVLCSLCRTEVGLRQDGRLREHLGGGQRCPGSGTRVILLEVAQYNTPERLAFGDHGRPLAQDTRLTPAGLRRR